MRIFRSAMGGAWDWLDRRVGLTPLIEKNLTMKLVPNDLSMWGCFGGLTLFVFIVQVISGAFLMMYYHPTPDEAFESVQFIRHHVGQGWIVHRVHSVAANVMIVFVIIHFLRVLYKRIYQNPRELHWISGVLLLGLTFFMGFTGYILPWSQLGYWAANIGTEIPSAIPLIGDKIVLWVRGGPELNELTLSRFYSMHVFILPAAIVALMAWHFAMIRATGCADEL
jgi:quinol-cytochrome oxidoreductase complex cytochrome b subunit